MEKKIKWMEVEGGSVKIGQKMRSGGGEGGRMTSGIGD